MVRFKFLAIIFTLFVCFSFAQKGGNGEQNKAMVDYKADLSRIKDKGRYVELIGNVVFYHNGVFITCDTAYRYSEQHMEGVGNVIINSDSTFIYGDKFVYNGETNIAQVFSPIIKTVDKDAILYTRNMEFNTLNNIGTYFGGGTTTQGGNLMESENGVYDSNNRSILLTGSVEMRNDNYLISADSVDYNFDSEVVTFLSRTDIWNHEGEFLQTKKGEYNTKTEIYDFYKESYILTEEQEVWADSMKYISRMQSAELKRDIQIFDPEKRVIMLGDDGRYWGGSKRMIMTDNPAVITYNKEKADSTYLRADTLLMIPVLDPTIIDSTKISLSDTISVGNNMSNMAQVMANDSLRNAPDSLEVNKKAIISSPEKNIATEQDIKKPLILDNSDEKEGGELTENNKANTDSTTNSAIDSLKSTLSKKELKKLEKEEKKEQKRQEREQKIRERMAKLHAHDHNHDHDHDHEKHIADSLRLDSIRIDSLEAVEKIEKLREIEKVHVADSSDYYIFGIRNVKSYSKEMQMVCDSMMINSVDSTTTLYIQPIVWNGTNQITADSLKILTRNGDIHKMEFFEFPILAQDIYNQQYNQIRGKYMEAFFIGGEVDVLYVDGNSECIYYMNDQGDITGMISVTSANMELYFENSEIADIKWFKDYKFDVYPIERVSQAPSQVVTDFKWNADVQPKSEKEITTRKVRPSQRKRAENIPKPLFYITEAIESEKISLSENGEWSDRNDPLPVDKNEFIFRQL
ncbi:MAG: OstA-like protein [Rikenellaceae bacterium]